MIAIGDGGLLDHRLDLIRQLLPAVRVEGDRLGIRGPDIGAQHVGQPAPTKNRFLY